MELSNDAAVNRAHWDRQSDEYQAAHGNQLAAHPMAWGAWSIPETELDVLGDVAGKDVLEFGCGAAQWSIALTKCRARCVGLDNSLRQLDHARKNQQSAGVDFPLVHSSAENVPLPDGSFDIVFCDHGAMTFADPLRTVPEVARLLRAGGLFAFSAIRRCSSSAGTRRPSASAPRYEPTTSNSIATTTGTASAFRCRTESGSSSFAITASKLNRLSS